MSNPARLFHIVTAQDWSAAKERGEYRPPSLAAEGFVHLSYAEQVTATANRFYRDLTDLQVIEFDPALVGSPVVIEDSYASGEMFPHVYAAMPTSAAVAEHPLPREANGDLSFDAPPA